MNKPTSQERQRSASEGIAIIARLIQRGWDCHTSMPRHHLYALRCPKFGGRDCLLVLREGRWQLLRSRRKQNRSLLLEKRGHRREKSLFRSISSQRGDEIIRG